MGKILVTDDSLLNRKLIRDILKSAGHEVIEASDGLEGINKAKEELPDLILMDIHMPNMDGITAMKKIREIPELKETPVIAITAYAMKGDRKKIIAEGFDDYIPKPVSIKDLIDKVSHCIKSSQSQSLPETPDTPSKR